MAIGQGNKIIASEINESASTSFSQGAAIKAEDIIGLYGGTDTIATGKLILAEHFQNLGLIGSGGLNGEFYTSSKNYKLKEAVDAQIIGYTYDNSSSNWQLTFPVGGTLKFSNFGKKGSAIDIFMIGGGGAGNKDGISGSGGFYSITKNKILTVGTGYSLVIGAGATTNGATGGATSGFGISVKGGYGGEAGKLANHYIGYTPSNWTTYRITLAQYGVEVDGVSYPQWESQSHMTSGEVIYFTCNENGKTEEVEIYKKGMIVTCHRGRDGYLYQLGGGTWGSVQGQLVMPSRPSDEMDKTTGFGGTTYYGGMGSTNSISAGTRYGQGGGSLGTYGNSSTSFGVGKSGLIIIRNHRS